MKIKYLSLKIELSNLKSIVKQFSDKETSMDGILKV